ncbi:MAG TPA: transcriptional regulator [Clostridiales bacterium]|nr:transcriptional regulator [Clostridiales bacterium]
MADETRMQILRMLSPGGELCACKILEAFDITQPTLSYHMHLLTEAGLVSGRRDGAWMRYTLNRENILSLQSFLGELAKGRNSPAEPEQDPDHQCGPGAAGETGEAGETGA